METLLLRDDQVKKLLSMSEVMEAVELAFKQKGIGRVQMPPKVYLYFKKYNGDLRTMPSYLEELDISAVKIVNVHPDNPSKYKLPTVMAVIILIDPSTGFPLAIMGGTTMTDMRTRARWNCCEISCEKRLQNRWTCRCRCPVKNSVEGAF